jgi:3-hydroxyisobutyrate dehydrogenase-like beta-hydroxyacid dehydrogenase
MSDNNDTSVTVIGLGLMGRALARAFLKAGHSTTVWNRTTSKADQLVAEGARLAPTVGDALKAASLTIICVTDYQAVHELLGGSDIELDGTTLINLTSGSSAQAREAARWAEQRGARYLDGAIMAIPSAIGTADAVILLSGPQPDVEAHRSTLDALGTGTYLGADHGLASLYDVAGLAMMWSILNAWLQGTALLRRPVSTPRRMRRSRSRSPPLWPNGCPGMPSRSTAAPSRPRCRPWRPTRGRWRT